MTSFLGTSKDNKTKILNIAFPRKDLILDPHKMEDIYSMTVVNQLYAKLFRYTPDGIVKNDLVDNWEVSPNNLIYTFCLKTVKNSEDKLITAKHIENSIKRIFILGSAIVSDLSIIKGAKKFAQTRTENKDENICINDLGVMAIDERKLQIELEKPSSLLIHLLAVPDLSVLSIEAPTEEIIFNSLTPYSGTYKVAEMDSDFESGRIILKKWRESELDSSNPPDEVKINLLSKIEPEKIVNGLLTDTSCFLTFDKEVSPLEGHKKWRPVASEDSTERFVILNPNLISFGVREWLLSKVDAEAFVKHFNDATVYPAFGFIPNCLPGYIRTRKSFKQKELELKCKIDLTISFGENLPHQNLFIAYLSKVWSHPNLSLTFEKLSVANYLELMFKKKGQIIIGAKGLDYPEGFSIVSYFRSNSDGNFFFVNSVEVDNLLDKAASEVDDAERFKIYIKIQELVLKQATVIPLAFGSWKKYYWSNRVEQVPPHPIGIQFMPFEMLEMQDSQETTFS